MLRPWTRQAPQVWPCFLKQGLSCDSFRVCRHQSPPGRPLGLLRLQTCLAVFSMCRLMMGMLVQVTHLEQEGQP